MAGKTLLKGGCVLTLGARTPNYGRADLLVEDGRVAEVGTDLRARDAETIDATDTIVMPGFVDAHRHLWASLFRNAVSAGPRQDLGPHLSADDVYAATLIGLLGAIEAGITTVVDWCDVRPEPGHLEAALQAHTDAGSGAVVVRALPSWADGAEPAPSLASRAPDRVTFAWGSGDPSASDIERLSDHWAQAREEGLRIHAHVGSGGGDPTAVSLLAERGLLGDDVTLVHCTTVDEAGLDAVAATRTGVVLTHSSEMAGGAGPPPIQALIDREIRPGLGVDDERVAPGDLFAQMRATISLQHAIVFDRKLAGKAGVPQLMSTRDVIRHATIDGARVAGVDRMTGSLEVGKRADIVVLRTDRPNIAPLNDAIGAVVWGMDTSNIDWVFAGGEAVVREGVLQYDTGRARDLVTQARARVMGAAGLMAGSWGGS